MRSRCVGEGGERGQMMIGIAQLGLDHCEAHEVMADRQFIGHAHAAMQLNGGLTDKFRSTAHTHLGSMQCPCARVRIVAINLHRRQQRQ